jgi:hypothetical protein
MSRLPRPVLKLPDLAPAPPPSAWRRWTVPVIGATLLLAVAALTTEVILLKNPGTHSGAAPEPADRPKPPEPGPRADRAPPPNPTPPADADGKKPVRPPDAVLSLVGGLTTAHLYQSYLNIGLTADAVARDVYKIEEGKELLDGVSRMMDVVERQLAQLPESELQPEERRHLDKVRRLLSLLRSAVKELKSFWDTGDEDYVRRFQKLRKDVQQELDKLLAEGE